MPPDPRFSRSYHCPSGSSAPSPIAQGLEMGPGLASRTPNLSLQVISSPLPGSRKLRKAGKKELQWAGVSSSCFLSCVTAEMQIDGWDAGVGVRTWRRKAGARKSALMRTHLCFKLKAVASLTHAASVVSSAPPPEF